MARSLTGILRSFARREEGATAMMFALATFPMIMAIGCAIDIGRATHTKTKLANAIDTATLGAARMLKDGKYTDAEIEASALAIFKENMRDSESLAVWTPSNFKLAIDKAASKITVEVPVYMPTSFARIGGIEQIDMTQKATAVFALRDIEVGLALDVTGSMGDTVAGKKKIDTLKASFEKFAKLMLPDSPLPGQKVRLGLAPYSAAINLGSYASVVSAGKSKDGCVTERTGSARYTDKSIAAGGAFRVKSDNASDTDATEGYGGYVCPSPVVTALTSDRAKLINDVKTYSPNGWTGGHFGAQWAYNLISPDWSSVWGGTSAPDDYAKVADKKLVKAVILMTDGVFNTAFHNGETSAQQAINLCTDMKSKGVLVFAIAFNAPPGAQATLKSCTTPGSEYYADANNESELDLAFAQFAGKINALRLAQ